MTMQWNRLWTLAVLGAVMAISAASHAADLPNFVIIFTDDQGYQDLGVFGSPNIKTPNIDRMAAEGMRFTDIEEIDWSVGQILDTLKQLGIDTKTMVVYTSDNGPWNLKGNTTSKVKGNTNRRVGGSAAPLRGYKFSRWEGGMREPTVMWWPDRIPAGSECRELAGTIDLLPTFAALSGTKLPGDRAIDGKSIVPLLEQRTGAKTPHEAYFYRTEGVRSGHWKLKGKELFDLVNDISEQHNVAKDHPDVLARLTKLRDDHKEELSKNRRPAGTAIDRPQN